MFWLWFELQNQYESFATLCSALMCALVAACITGYQRHLSPLKGYSCAHRVLHNDLSCSEYTKQAVMQNGVFAGLGLMRARFAECGAASHQLRFSAGSEASEEKKRKQNGCSGGLDDDCCGWAINGADCGCNAAHLAVVTDGCGTTVGASVCQGAEAAACCCWL